MNTTTTTESRSVSPAYAQMEQVMADLILAKQFAAGATSAKLRAIFEQEAAKLEVELNRLSGEVLTAWGR